MEIQFGDKPIVREISQYWDVGVSYVADDPIVEIVILDAIKSGFMPFHRGGERQAA